MGSRPRGQGTQSAEVARREDATVAGMRLKRPRRLAVVEASRGRSVKARAEAGRLGAGSPSYIHGHNGSSRAA